MLFPALIFTMEYFFANFPSDQVAYFNSLLKIMSQKQKNFDTERYEGWKAQEVQKIQDAQLAAKELLDIIEYSSVRFKNTLYKELECAAKYDCIAA